MHGPESPAIAVLTLGAPALEGLGWAVVDAGFRVLSFETLDDAAPALQDGEIGVLVLNALAPDVLKLELAAAARALDPEVAVVDVADHGATRHDGFDAAIHLPLDRDLLGATLSRLLEQHQRSTH